MIHVSHVSISLVYYLTIHNQNVLKIYFNKRSYPIVYCGRFLASSQHLSKTPCHARNMHIKLIVISDTLNKLSFHCLNVAMMQNSDHSIQSCKYLIFKHVYVTTSVLFYISNVNMMKHCPLDPMPE